MNAEEIKRSDSPFSSGLPALYIVALLSGISLGLFNPFISTLMAQKGIDDFIIGLNSTLYFFIIAIGTPIVAAILRKIGLRYTMMLGFGLMAISASLYPLTDQLSHWFVIRGIMGLAVCLYLISGQTAVNYFCSDRNRGIVNGLDALFFSLGFGIGPVLGSIFYKIHPNMAFWIGSILIFSGIIVVHFGLPEKSIRFQPIRIGLFGQLVLPLQGAFTYGFSVATLVSIYPAYLIQQRHDVGNIGYVFSLFMLGGLISTIPITQWSDRLDQKKILLGCVLLTIISIFSLSLVSDFRLILLVAFISGAGMTPIFPLSLSLITSKLEVEELPSGSALFTSAYSAGCAAGPILSATIMKIWGINYIFTLMLMFFISFGVFLLRPVKTVRV
jgi:MFS family permease